MSQYRISAIVVVAAALVCAASAVSSFQAPAEPDVLVAAGPLQWRRGNLHTHSHWSDGNDYLEMIALWYKDHGYDFLCFTDHNVLATTERWVVVDKTKGGRVAFDKLKARFPDWIEERTVDGELQVRLRRFDEVRDKIGEPDRFLLIQGEEISDHFKNYPIHLNASNVQELIPPMSGGSVYETMQNNVDAVVAQRERTGEPILVHLNHPNFYYAVTAEDLMHLHGEKFFEVYNGHPSVHNSGDDGHPSTERIWDIILTERLAILDLPLMYGLAVDDGHDYHHIPGRFSQPGRGWVMVLTDELTTDALIDALEAGRFYASSGVSLSRIASSPAFLEVEVAAEPGVDYTIEFIGTRRGFDRASEAVVDDDGNELHTTRRYSSDVGEVFNTVHGPTGIYEFSGDELYVRARITSSKEHPNPAELGDFEQAWCQPVLGPGLQ